MHKILLTIAVCVSIKSAAHKTYTYRTDNVYNRDVPTILNYAETFINQEKNLFIKGDADTSFSMENFYEKNDSEIVVHGEYVMRRPASFCLGSIVLSVDIAFMAKTGRSREELRDVRYYVIPPGGKSKYVGSGDYEDLKNTDCSKHTEYIIDFLNGEFDAIVLKYKAHLKKKTRDGSW